MNVCEFTAPPRSDLRSGVASLGFTTTMRSLPEAFVVPDAVDDDRVEVDDLLDVLGPRLVVARVDLAREDGAHLDLGPVADHVLGPRVVRVQRHPDLERLRGHERLRDDGRRARADGG